MSEGRLRSLVGSRSHPGPRATGGDEVSRKQLQALAGRVAELRDRIVRVRKRGEPIGEEDTKRVFVNPLLQTLGVGHPGPR